MTSAAVRSAAAELTALAVQMRGWDDDEIRRSIAACQVKGWPFAQTALEMVRLAVMEGTEPGDLARQNGKRRPTSFADVQPATDQLVALAVQMRDDWAEPDLRYALATCHGGGWAFGQAALEVARLMVIPDSEPRDLTAAARSPFARRTLGDRRG